METELPFQLIVDLYKSGQSATQIAKTVGSTHPTILKLLDKHNVPRTDVRNFRRKYKNIKEDYFDSIDSEEKAYFMGLLYADGSVKMNQYSSSISLGLIEEDEEILHRYSYLIFGENTVKYRDFSSLNKKNQCVLHINNKVMCQKLSSLGCTPNKSLTLTWPSWLLDTELQKHFIRGYFDGDGCLSRRKNGNYQFNLVSTLEFCDNVDSIINKQISIHFSRYRPDKNKTTTIISTGGNVQVLRLMDWLYENSNFYLKRKHNKYLQLKAE